MKLNNDKPTWIFPAQVTAKTKLRADVKAVEIKENSKGEYAVLVLETKNGKQYLSSWSIHNCMYDTDDLIKRQVILSFNGSSRCELSCPSLELEEESI